MTALLVKKYQIELGPRKNGKLVERDLRDEFTAAPGQLNLSFRKVTEGNLA